MPNVGFGKNGERLGKSEAWISKRLSLALDIIKEVKNAILTGEITIAQGRR